MGIQEDLRNPGKFWDMKNHEFPDTAQLGGTPTDVVHPETIRAIDNASSMITEDPKTSALVRDILLELEHEAQSEFDSYLTTDWDTAAYIVHSVLTTRWWHKSPWTWS